MAESKQQSSLGDKKEKMKGRRSEGREKSTKQFLNCTFDELIISES
jgi:hypothetical protein